jgi:signal transduction histidine kinase
VTITASVRAGRRSSDPQQWVCITVHDQGPGVADRELVFEEVARAESTTSTPGFRLAISRRIARLLGGDLSLESRPTGSSFSLWLPMRSSLLLHEVAALANEDPALESANADLRSALPEGE